MTARTPHEEEVGVFRRYATEHADPLYREIEAALYRAWDRWNREFQDGFGGPLREPHIVLDRTPPRVLAEFSPLTGHGARSQLKLSPGTTVTPDPEWVVNPWPAEGTQRLVLDLGLRLTLRQVVWERHHTLEPGYRGYGPHFATLANRVWARMDSQLAPPGEVVSVRRPGDPVDTPLASDWPCCLRPAGYYGDDVTEACLRMAGVGRAGRPQAHPAPPSLGLLELLSFLINAGRTDDTLAIIRRQIDWLQEVRLGRLRPHGRAERGQADVDGSPLGVVAFDPAWLTWENGVVRKIADGIRENRSFAELPVLADALEEAGCIDGRILRHCRARMKHTRSCWVLRGLLAAGRNGCTHDGG